MLWIAIWTAMAGPSAKIWHGPATVSFDLAVEGSPYDGQTQDVRVRFDDGPISETRLAYFDGSKWHAILLAPKGGTYTATVLLNGRAVQKLPNKVEAKALFNRPFIRLADDKRGFVDEFQARYWPIGHNLGWADRRTGMTVPEQLVEMGRHGLNWARIWACSWDGKNPFFSEGMPPAKGRDLLPKVMDQWDGIVAAAASSSVRFQFVLFHHGMFSTKTDANWNINSWNVANGGFLAKPEEFFTDPEAKARAKNWLRYAVARWGHEPAILAWELFNEVEWVDAFGAGQGEKVGQWHDEMADYLRSIDPYRRLVVSSSGMQLPIWRKMDYYQPHGYPPDIKALVLGTKPTQDRPLFFGEVGLGGGPGGAERERMAVRGALWPALMAGHAGAAQYWYWDRVVLDKLYPEYARFIGFYRSNRLNEAPAFQPVASEWASRKSGAIAFGPGQGWATTTKFEFQMPRDAESGALGSLSGFIQGPGKKDMMAQPIRFVFESAEAGKFVMTVGTIARMGAQVRMLLDGQAKVDEIFEPQDRDRPINRSFALDFGPGRHTVTIENPGPDWYMVDRFRIDGVGQAVAGNAAKNGESWLLRLTNATGSDSEAFSVSGLGIPDGPVAINALDLDTGRNESFHAEVKNGVLAHTLRGKDAAWLVRAGKRFRQK